VTVSGRVLGVGVQCTLSATLRSDWNNLGIVSSELLRRSAVAPGSASKLGCILGFSPQNTSQSLADRRGGAVRTRSGVACSHSNLTKAHLIQPGVRRVFIKSTKTLCARRCQLGTRISFIYI